MRRSSVVSSDVDHRQLIHDLEQIAFHEAKNGLRQFDEMLHLVRESGWQLALSSQLICQLQKIAVDGVWSSAGKLRNFPVGIRNTQHVPPNHTEVPHLVNEMCEYANSHADQPFHVSAYLMWRLNWIHPFGDGNGRTSRVVSYMALSISLGMELPGSPTIPDLIVKQKEPYYRALDSADAMWLQGKLDVSKMEQLITELLQIQLSSLSDAS